MQKPIIEHFASSAHVNDLYTNGLLTFDQYVLMSLHAQTPQQLQELRELYALREPSELAAHINAQSMWDISHIWNRHCTCRFCGMSAREALAKGMEINCPTRRQSTPDFL